MTGVMRPRLESEILIREPLSTACTRRPDSMSVNALLRETLTRKYVVVSNGGNLLSNPGSGEANGSSSNSEVGAGKSSNGSGL